MVFVKYMDIERLGTPENDGIFANPDDEIIVEEKVDGGNGCFFLEDGIIHVCSRNRDLTHENDEKTFKVQRDATLATLEQHRDAINPGWLYYVEWMAKHTIRYPTTIPPAIGLDIKPKEGAFGHTPCFIGRRAKEDAFKALGIECVSLKGIYKAKDMTDLLMAKLCEKSAYYDGKPEGICMKNYGRMNVWGRQMFGKIVLDEFKETNRAVFGGLKKDNSDTIKIVDSYITPARIRKRIQAFIIEGGLPLDRKLMHHLPIAVIKDVFKEETNEIVKKYDEIHIGVLKQFAAKRCLVEIDAMMVEKQRDENGTANTAPEAVRDMPAGGSSQTVV